MPASPDSSGSPESPYWLRFAPGVFLLLWSCGFVVLKFGLRFADPLTFLALRYSLVVVVLGIGCLWLRPRFPRRAAQWLHLAAVGLMLQAGYFCSTYLSLEHGMSAGALALVTSQQPILIALLAPALAGERVDATRWLGLGLGVGGALLVIVSKSSIQVSSPLGLVFAVSALLCMTCGTLWEKRFGSPVHPLAANLVQYAVSLLVVAPLAWALEPMRVQWAPGMLVALAYLVVANSIIAITLLLAMIRHGEASRVSALFFLVPPATAVVAFVLLGERIPPLAWPGMVLAAAGLRLVNRPAAPPAGASRPATG